MEGHISSRPTRTIIKPQLAISLYLMQMDRLEISMWMGTSRPLALAYTHTVDLTLKSSSPDELTDARAPTHHGEVEIGFSEVGPQRQYYLTSVVRVSCVIESVKGIVWSIYCQSFLKHDSWLLQNMQDILNTQKVHALGLKNTEGIRANANMFKCQW